MNAEHVQEIDARLAQLGITYHCAAEKFLRGDQPVDWEEFRASLPYLSLNDLMAYEQAKQEPTREHNPHVAAKDEEIRLDNRNL